VHGKASMLFKRGGWHIAGKAANLRALYAHTWMWPGKKLLFMGGEFAQWKEWNHDASLDWHAAEHGPHKGMQNWVRDLNMLYRLEPALYELNCSSDGFEWIDANDSQQSTVALLRKDRSGGAVLAICNFTPIARVDYLVGVPRGGFWKELLNSDSGDYWGSGLGNMGGVEATQEPSHGRPWSLRLTLPPLSALFFKSPQ
jgi:1,4-alpha-glucan branching enzyme